MANAHVTSQYLQYWELIKEAQSEKKWLCMQVPPELHARVIKAIRKRKWLEQVKYGRNYGKLVATSRGGEIIFRLLPAMEHTI